jgi:hypothetical protein
LKKAFCHIILLSGLGFMLSGCGRKGVALPDMSRNFYMNSKKPMGTYTAYKLFEAQFQSYYIHEIKQSFSKVHNDLEGQRNLYFIVADELIVTPQEIDDMLEYVNKGNRLFIAARYFDERILDTLGVHARFNGNEFSMFQTNALFSELRPTKVSMNDTLVSGNKTYGFFYYGMMDYFTRYDSVTTRVLGLNEKKQPNFIAVTYGNGVIYFHLHPETFSNYFLLKGNNKEYFEQVLSYMNSNRQTVYWDDYYRRGIYPQKNFSFFSVFLKYPPLKWALYVALAGLALFVFMGMKRRQRAIPLTVPNTNSSVNFVETIGRLYLQRKDHHNIVHKMITYFLEKIRTKYYLNTTHINAEFISSLAKKSSVPEEHVKSTFQYIQQLQEAPAISDAELLELHNRLLPFFKS